MTMNKRDGKRVAPNTYKYTNVDGEEVIRLYATDIILTKPSGVKSYSNGGYQTPTTKDRLNTFGDLAIRQEKGKWICTDKAGNESYFYNGICTAGGAIISPLRPIMRRPIYVRDREPERPQGLIPLLKDYV